MAGNETSPPVVVCDAGPLIHLDELGCVELLADFPQVIVPAAVWEEIRRHRPGALAPAAVRFLQIPAPLSLSSQLDSLCRLMALHRGEVEALHVRPDLLKEIMRQVEQSADL